MIATAEPAHRVRALLFDLDGTLVNSIAVVERTWRRFADRHGLNPQAVLAACHGRRAGETVTLFASPEMDVEAEVQRLTAEEIADIEGIVAVPGARELLAVLPRERWAIVTSASRTLAMTRLDAAGLLVPDVLVTAEDVTNGKPAPDGYLMAARALGVSAAECLVFEDAPAGLQAGRAAGAAVVAVTSVHRLQSGRPDGAIADFTALDVTPQPEGDLAVSIAPPAERRT